MRLLLLFLFCLVCFYFGLGMIAVAEGEHAEHSAGLRESMWQRAEHASNYMQLMFILISLSIFSQSLASLKLIYIYTKHE